MNNSLNDLMRERFQGHEAPVDPGTWAVIEARLLTAAPASDPVNDLFRERFQNHESVVDPNLWNGISNQLGHPVASSGWAGTFGWLAAGIAGMVTLGALLLTMNSGTPEVTVMTSLQADSQDEIVAVPRQADPVAEPATRTPSEPATKPAARSQLQTRAAAGQGPAVDPVAVVHAIPPAEEEAVVVEQIIEGLTVQTMLEVLANEPTPAKQPTETGRLMDPVAENPIEAAEPPIAEEMTKLFMPNTFTPNGDGINDTYRILPRNGFTSVLVRVYSMKNNQLVFSSASMDDEWQGLNCDDGMYLVAVEAITLNGRVVADGKVVWLNRGSTN